MPTTGQQPHDLQADICPHKLRRFAMVLKYVPTKTGIVVHNVGHILHQPHVRNRRYTDMNCLLVS